MRLFWAEISGQPVPQGRPKFARGRVYYGKTSTAYRKEVVELFEGLHHADPITEPVCLTIKLFGLSDNADIDNVCKQLTDALVEAEVLADDNSTIVREIHVIAFDSLEPHAEVVVERLGDYVAE